MAEKLPYAAPSNKNMQVPDDIDGAARALFRVKSSCIHVCPSITAKKQYRDPKAYICQGRGFRFTPTRRQRRERNESDRIMRKERAW